MSDFVITAKNNPKIKEIRALLASAKERRNTKLFVLEGVRLCCDAVKSGCEIGSVFYTESCEEKFFDDISELKSAAAGCFCVSEEIFKSISDTVTPQGVVCTVKIPENTFEYREGGKYIALDTVQNPDNLGAVSRTAEALGIDGLIVSGGCDIYNPKALRASMGALLRLPVLVCADLGEEIKKAEALGIPSFAAVPDSTAKSVTEVYFGAGALCIIGNEGNGVSKEIIDKCRYSVTIKMRGRAESLNAAAAASIIMWELVK